VTVELCLVLEELLLGAQVEITASPRREGLAHQSVYEEPETR
jgi:hypothetical protein